MPKQVLGYKEGEERLVAVIADHDTVTGFLMAGLGEAKQSTAQSNFLIVDADTSYGTIEAAFRQFIARTDIAIILISQPIAQDLKAVISQHKATVPMVLEIPAATVPYDISKDPLLSAARFSSS